jgi:putative tryptophan/tyrosine transport system substrate-binding protein
MRRREFMAALGGVAVWPIASDAQQSAVPVIRFLASGSPEGFEFLHSAFQAGLGEFGYVEGRNVQLKLAGRRAAMID